MTSVENENTKTGAEPVAEPVAEPSVAELKARVEALERLTSSQMLTLEADKNVDSDTSVASGGATEW